MINVCAHYCGTTILLDSFENKEDAEEFMKHDYVLHYADEIENAEEDELIYSDEMFISDENIPFAEPISNEEIIYADDLDELPF